MAKSNRADPPTPQGLADALSDVIDIADALVTRGSETYTLAERRRRDAAERPLERMRRGFVVGGTVVALVVAAEGGAWARGGGGHGGGSGGHSLGAVHLLHTGNSAPYPPHLPYNQQGEPSGGHAFEKFFTKVFGG